jgi:hypothetical protein
VALSAGYVDLSSYGFLGQVVSYYGTLSGAGESYGFFAPGISGQLGVHFDVISKNGKISTLTLKSDTNHEADLRIGNIINHFQETESDHPENLRRSIAASLAGSVFGHDPDAKEVVVYLDQFLPVSMEEYRKGSRPQWESLYQARFLYAAK